MSVFPKRDKDSLQDIMRACQLIHNFIDGMSQEQFVDDAKTFSAVEMQLMIIGEASTRLSDSLRDKYHHIAWRSIIGMRNILIHQYGNVDDREVWLTAIESIPKLETQVEIILKDEF